MIREPGTLFSFEGHSGVSLIFRKKEKRMPFKFYNWAAFYINGIPERCFGMGMCPFSRFLLTMGHRNSLRVLTPYI
jgi:hypothetical protein